MRYNAGELLRYVVIQRHFLYAKAVFVNFVRLLTIEKHGKKATFF